MRLRPSPLTEAASTFAIAFLIVLVWYVFKHPASTDAGSMASTAAVLIMFPIFTAMTLIGFAIRARKSLTRFLCNLGLTVFWTVGASLMFWNGANSRPTSASLEAAHVLIGACTLVLIANLVALAVTYRFVIDDNKVKLTRTQYSSNPVVSSKSKRKKK